MGLVDIRTSRVISKYSSLDKDLQTRTFDQKLQEEPSTNQPLPVHCQHFPLLLGEAPIQCVQGLLKNAFLL